MFFKLRYFVFFLLCTNVGFVTAQWTQTDGPYGYTDAYDIWTHDSDIYAATNCGLFIKDSSQSKWNLVVAVENGVYAQKGDTIFFDARTGNLKYIVLSDVNKEIRNFGFEGMRVNCLLILDTCIIAGVYDKGFYKSIGFTDSWIPINQGITFDSGVNNYPYWLELIGNEVFCGTAEGVFKTQFDNIFWTPVNEGLETGDPQNFFKLVGDSLYTSTYMDVYAKDIDENKWNHLFTGPSRVSSFTKWNNDFYAGTEEDGLFKSSDNGVSWKSFNNGLPDSKILSLNKSESNLLIGTERYGIYYLEGDTWQDLNSGLVCSNIYSLAANSKTLASNDENSVYYSVAGANWVNITEGEQKNGRYGATEIIDNDIFYSYRDENHSTVIKKYSLLDQSWYLFAWELPLDAGDPYQMLYNENGLFVYSNDYVYYSEDKGISWEDISHCSLSYCDHITDIVNHGSDTYMTTGNYKAIFKLSVNKTWRLIDNNLAEQHGIHRLGATSDALFAFLAGNGAYVSKDNGITWTLATSGLEFRHGVRDFVSLDNRIFVTTDYGVFYSDNLGEKWEELNDGLLNTDATSIIIFNDSLFVGSRGNGVWKHAISDIASSTVSHSTLVENISLYPNPTSHTLHLKSMDSQSFRFSMYSIDGQLILNESGKSDYHVDVQNIPSGLYVVQSFLSGEISINKVIIK